MRYTIHHELEFKTSQPVFFEPQLFNLCPRTDGAQRLIDFSLSISPEPAGHASILDAEGNVSQRVWFNGLHDTLKIKVTSEVETLRANPFDFLPDPTMGTLPQPYPKLLIPLLKPSLFPAEKLTSIKDFLNPILKSSQKNVLDFLYQLTLLIHSGFKMIRRETGTPWSPGKTLSMRVGSCRDLTVLFIACCRSVGLAARFVSGYFEGDSLEQEKDLHAWAEVFVPGGGWRGYDPLNGLVVADRHIALAASHNSALAAATTGSFRGTGAEEKLVYKIRIIRTLPVLISENIEPATK